MYLTLFPYTTLFRSDAVRRELKRFLSLRDALRTWIVRVGATLDGEHVIAFREHDDRPVITVFAFGHSVCAIVEPGVEKGLKVLDRKSTRLNSSHRCISPSFPTRRSSDLMLFGANSNAF